MHNGQVGAISLSYNFLFVATTNPRDPRGDRRLVTFGPYFPKHRDHLGKEAQYMFRKRKSWMKVSIPLFFLLVACALFADSATRERFNGD
jgi:hypothetical protein